MHTIKQQQGFTLITLIILFMVIGFFGLLILKIGPIYMNHSKILNSFAALEQTDNIENETTHRIRNIIDGRFNINYVEHLKVRDIQILNRPNYLKLVVEYEVVEPIFGNLSVLIEFYEEVIVEPGADN